MYASGDCLDSDGNVNPRTTRYKDADNDNYSDGTRQKSCTDPGVDWELASTLTGAGGDTSGDCDDTNAELNPATIWYQDIDGDNYASGTTV